MCDSIGMNHPHHCDASFNAECFINFIVILCVCVFVFDRRHFTRLAWAFWKAISATHAYLYVCKLYIGGTFNCIRVLYALCLYNIYIIHIYYMTWTMRYMSAMHNRNSDFVGIYGTCATPEFREKKNIRSFFLVFNFSMQRTIRIAEKNHLFFFCVKTNRSCQCFIRFSVFQYMIYENIFVYQRYWNASNSKSILFDFINFSVK